LKLSIAGESNDSCNERPFPPFLVQFPFPKLKPKRMRLLTSQAV
jgi:hypothetical protein